MADLLPGAWVTTPEFAPQLGEDDVPGLELGLDTPQSEDKRFEVPLTPLAYETELSAHIKIVPDVEKNAVPETPTKQAIKQGPIFNCDHLPPPKRSNTLELRAQEFSSQVAKVDEVMKSRRRLYHSISQDIVQTLAECFSLDVLDNAAISLAVEKTTNVLNRNISGVLENIVAQKKTEIHFTETDRAEESFDVLAHLPLVKFLSRVLSREGKCAVNTKEHRRCKMSIAKVDIHSFVTVKRKLATLSFPCEFVDFVSVLVDVFNGTICKRFHRTDATRSAKDLCTRLYTSTSFSDREKMAAIVGDWIVETFRLAQEREGNFAVIKREALDDDAKENEPIYESCAAKAGIEPRQTHHIQSEQNDAQERYPPTSQSPSDSALAFTFNDPNWRSKLGQEPKLAKMAATIGIKDLALLDGAANHNETSIAKLVHNTAQRPVEGMKEGYVYIYKYLETFGFVKIGYAEDIAKRLKQWEIGCQHPVAQCSSRLQDLKRRVPHAQRVEQLVHAELKGKQYAQTKACGVCGKCHREWFAVTENEAQHVVMKWTKWMQELPYDENGRLRADVQLPAIGDFKETLQNDKPRARMRISDSKNPEGGQRRAQSAVHFVAERSHRMTTRSQHKAERKRERKLQELFPSGEWTDTEDDEALVRRA